MIKIKRQNDYYIIFGVPTAIILIGLLILNIVFISSKYSNAIGIITTSIFSGISGVATIILLKQNINLNNKNSNAQEKLAEKEKEFQKELVEKEKEFQLLKRKKELEKSIVEYDNELNLKIEHIGNLQKMLDNTGTTDLQIEIKDTESFIYWKSIEYSNFITNNKIVDLGIMTELEWNFLEEYIKFVLSLRNNSFDYKKLEVKIKGANEEIKNILPITYGKEFKSSNMEEVIKFKEKQYEYYKLLELNPNEGDFWINCQKCLINSKRVRIINKYNPKYKGNE